MDTDDTDTDSSLENSEVDELELDYYGTSSDQLENVETEKYSVIKKLFNRQLYGRIARNPRAKNERIFNTIPERCTYSLANLLPRDDSAIHHVFMGMTQCGRFLLSYNTQNYEMTERNLLSRLSFQELFSLMYMLSIWSFVPGRPLRLVAEYRVLKHSKNLDLLDITICQWPTNMDKLVIYGASLSHKSESYLTIVSLPSVQRCKDCNGASNIISEDAFLVQPPTSQCLKHGVIVDLMLSIMPPHPVFKPHISLAYPDYVILNTGHYLYALNVSLNTASLLGNIHKTNSLNSLAGSELFPAPTPASMNTFPDNVSDISESISVKQDCEYNANKIVNDIIADFSDCDTENSDYSKPFHELNITCDPLNVTARSYWTSTSVSEPSTLKPRLKYCRRDVSNLSTSIQSSTNDKSQKTAEKAKIDIKKAEKAYEFTEENEKCEKLSLFRKKRLADKKYEFSDDNCENIVPFTLLRHERRIFGKAQSSRCFRSNISPDIQLGGCFLSPRSSGIRSSPRSPVLSPNTRTGPFSPSSSRNAYSKISSPSQICRKSPIGTSNHKYDIYSPSHIDSDCSDNDSKLVLRQINNIPPSPRISEFIADMLTRTDSPEKFTTSGMSGSENGVEGLLMVDEKLKASFGEQPVWIKEIVRRYSYLDFECGSSQVSENPRDDNVSVEPPAMVTAWSSGEEHYLDVVPKFVSNEVLGTSIVLVHRMFDAEQFCHRIAKKICTENNIKFTFCADYDIEILDVCPLSGDITCTANIDIGAESLTQSAQVEGLYTLRFMFVWGINKHGNEQCTILEPLPCPQPRSRNRSKDEVVEPPMPTIERVNCRKIRVMTHKQGYESYHQLKDDVNYINIVFDVDSSEESRRELNSPDFWF